MIRPLLSVFPRFSFRKPTIPIHKTTQKPTIYGSRTGTRRNRKNWNNMMKRTHAQKCTRVPPNFFWICDQDVLVLGLCCTHDGLFWERSPEGRRMLDQRNGLTLKPPGVVVKYSSSQKLVHDLLTRIVVANRSYVLPP